MIFPDPGIHTEFQPFHIILGRAFHADFLITAIHDRHKILPPQPILEWAATPAFSTRSKPGKRIPPDHLLDILHTDDRHTGLGKDRLIRILDVSKRQARVVPNFPVETPPPPIDMFGLGLCKASGTDEDTAASSSHSTRFVSSLFLSRARRFLSGIENLILSQIDHGPVFGIAVLPL